MREHGAEVVVVLSHMMNEDTLRVVDRVPGIDVALGTHLGDATLRPDIASPDEFRMRERALDSG
jgi:hypothetical protein